MAFHAIYILILLLILIVMALLFLAYYYKRSQRRSPAAPLDPRFRTLTMFLSDIENEKPIRFTPLELSLVTDSYSQLLGVGAFGAVYKGSITEGILVAVKVLRERQRVEEQFMAEVDSIGRAQHLNLVRLYGFCYERDLRALVYEYMPNSSLDQLLFDPETATKPAIDWERLHDIAVGTAKGITYLHEECQQKILHYNIKPGNVLLDTEFQPKVADSGLARLCSRDANHLTITSGRGTPAYTAPELWMSSMPVTQKCDVYSFGMLLFEMLGRRRNCLDEASEWFPIWVWKRHEKGELEDALVAECGIEEEHRHKARRMALVALWCVQYQPVPRPCMSVVVKMLEGQIDIPEPSNPFSHMLLGSPYPPMAFDYRAWTGRSNSGRTLMSAGNFSTPIMRKYEIEFATS